jgi:hypothetical protein
MRRVELSSLRNSVALLKILRTSKRAGARNYSKLRAINYRQVISAPIFRPLQRGRCPFTTQ